MTNLEFDSDDKLSKVTIIKTGQFPSLADLHISKVKDYDKVPDEEKLKEFTRAIGLTANGAGIDLSFT